MDDVKIGHISYLEQQKACDAIDTQILLQRLADAFNPHDIALRFWT